MKKILVWSVLVLLLSIGSHALGQTTSADSSLSASAFNSLSQHYTSALRYESGLYNGPEYVNYVKPYLKGHPFFESAEAREATVEYGGSSYIGVPLRYDLMLGQLAVQAPSGALALRLVNERVARFTLGGHTFVRLVANPTNPTLSTGFYELLVDGPVQVLAARKKGIQERSTSDGMVGEINQRNEFFIRKANHYYPVSKASSVLRLFPENKAALRKHIGAQKLKFNKVRFEEAIVELVRYHASITSPAPAAH